MGWIAWIVVGGLAGWLASILMKTESMGLVVNIIVGIIGAFVGGAIMGLITGSGFTGFNIWSILVAVVGAVVLLAIIKLVKRTKE